MVDIDISLLVIVTNTLVVLATFIATLYRIKIERDQIRTFKQNTQATKCLDAFRKYVKAEHNSIMHMDKTELEKFVTYLEKLRLLNQVLIKTRHLLTSSTENASINILFFD